MDNTKKTIIGTVIGAVAGAAATFGGMLLSNKLSAKHAPTNDNLATVENPPADAPADNTAE